MKRAGILLLMLLAGQARMQARAASFHGMPPPGYDMALTTELLHAALSFMAPRTLEPIPVPTMTVWGLRGLTALDPALTPGVQGGTMRLADRNRLLLALPAPAPADVAGWSVVAARLCGAAWQASAAVRRAGMQGLFTSFFDELFNHLDPYSRYIPPGRMAEETALSRTGTAAAQTVFAMRLGGMLVLRIADFNAMTGPALDRAIRQGLAARPAPRGLVLDLRGNRGGLLRAAVAAARTLLARGVVVTTAGRFPAATHVWRAHGTDLPARLPIIVLVDGRTASAAEILAAALADHHRAVVVGSTTLGKGLVQVATPLPDGGELLLTWSRDLAPDGWPIQGLGVLPAVCTSLGQNALERQLEALSYGQQPMRSALAQHRGARAPLPLAQVLSIREACPAAVGHESDLQAAQFLVRDRTAYATALAGP